MNIIYNIYYNLAYSAQRGCVTWKPFDYAWFEVLEARHCSLLHPKNGTFKARYFCRTLDKFARRAKLIPITGEPNNQRPHKWSSAVHEILGNRHCGLKSNYI